MTLPPSEKLRELSRDELIVLCQLLMERLSQLEAEVAALKQKLPPGTSSNNSSQPPARGWKADAPSGQGKRKRSRKKPGAQPGHAKAERLLADNPDTIIPVHVAHCAGCGADMEAVQPERVWRRQIVEWPEVKPLILETQQDEVCCPYCQLRQKAKLPAGLEAERFLGPRLEGLVTYFHQVHHLGFQRLQQVLKDVLGVTLCTGSEVGILERAGAAAAPEAEVIDERVRASTVIGSDESSCRVHGRNHWEWVFVSRAGVASPIAPPNGDLLARFGLQGFNHLRHGFWASGIDGENLIAAQPDGKLCRAFARKG